MAFKLGNLNISTFAGDNKSNVSLLGGKNPHDGFSIPTKISVLTHAGEDPLELHKRMLREAASRAGLDGTRAQETFVEKYAQFGIDFSDPKDDPSPSNGLAVNAGEIKTKHASYTLQPDQVDSLKSLQKEYVAAGGKLHHGKSYQPAPNAAAVAKQANNDEAHQRDKLNSLLRDAQILPTSLGTPSKLRDLKHISVTLPENLQAGLSNEDHALLAYLQKTYGSGNLQGDNIKEILALGKQNGVRAENVSVAGGKAEFDLSVENLLKLHTAYIAVQAKTNTLVDLFQKTADNSVASSFTRGVFEGAWEDLKANGQMLADPVGTIAKLAELVQQLAAIDPVLVGKAAIEMAANSPELIKQGAAAISNTKVADAAHATGKLVGAAAMEAVLGKGAAVAFKGLLFLGKTESGMRLLQQIGGATQKAKETIGSLQIPVKSAEVVLTDGSKIKIPFGETKRLDEIILQMKSSVEKLGMLKGGSTAGKETLTKVAEDGLTEKAQSGLKHLKGEIPKAVMAEAKEQLVTLNVARTELMARLDDLVNKVPSLANSQKAVADIGSAKNSLLDHLTQDDLVGALRDKFGEEVRRSGDGKVFQHSKEVNEAIDSLKTARRSIADQIERQVKGSTEYKILSQEADALAEMIRKVEGFLDIQ